MQGDALTNLQGYIIERTAWTRDESNPDSRQSKLYQHDRVVPIKHTALSENTAACNRLRD